MEPTDGSTADRVVGVVARTIARAWFSAVEVEGLERVPAGPVIAAANHPNGFVDPVLVRAHLPRPARFLAKQALWRIRPLGALLDAVGALPVERAADGEATTNRSTFAACHEVLAAGGTVAVFPEGDVHGDSRLHRLRTGTARIALGARAAGVRGVRIVPVGLVYAEQTAPRERALVRVGDPIDVDAVAAAWEAEGGGPVGESSREVVQALTATLTDRLRVAAVDYADRGEALALRSAVGVRERTASGGEDATIARVEPLLRRLAAAPEHHRRAVVDALATYQLRLDLLRVDDAAVAEGSLRARSHRHGLVAVAAVAGLAPLAVPGLAANIVPYVVVDFLATRPMARASRANFQVLASVAAFPLAWLGTALALRRLGAAHPWRWTAVAGPLGGLAALAATERVQSIQRGRVALKGLLRNPDQLPVLAELRAAVVTAVDAALAADSAGEPTTAPA